MNTKVDQYLSKVTHWKKEQECLRRIVLSTNLKEEFKWGNPCYTYNGGNVVLIHVFKEYCALLFFKGALMQDPEGILIQQTKNVQATRQIRFTRLEEILSKEEFLKSYIVNAIEIEKSGLKVELKKTEEFPFPKEFEIKLEEDPALKLAFNSLSPGRQRAYLLHFSAPKQAGTREARVEKWIPAILEGKGLND